MVVAVSIFGRGTAIQRGARVFVDLSVRSENDVFGPFCRRSPGSQAHFVVAITVLNDPLDASCKIEGIEGACKKASNTVFYHVRYAANPKGDDRYAATVCFCSCLRQILDSGRYDYKVGGGIQHRQGLIVVEMADEMDGERQLAGCAAISASYNHGLSCRN